MSIDRDHPAGILSPGSSALTLVKLLDKMYYSVY